MNNLSHLDPRDVFGYFEKICSIPHGSGDMEKISSFCMDFAKKHGLWATRDEANNVIIKKPASKGYENAEPVILQGHLDMVCQKEPASSIRFEEDGIEVLVDGEFIRAKGTTLGADDGIAVAMMLAILADNSLSHPPIEAVFTTDEEIGMIGAKAMDMAVLSGKRMINLDSGNPAIVTVSCAGGSDLTAFVPIKREQRKGTAVSLSVKGLKGGHSGTEIHKGRVNANLLMGRILHHLSKTNAFSVISVFGGDKGNAIPVSCTAKLLTSDPDGLSLAFENYAGIVREEIRAREEGFAFDAEILEAGAFAALDDAAFGKLLHALILAPNGVMEMSAEIENLVETSLNLGILKTEDDKAVLSFALRSNKKTAMAYLEERLSAFFTLMECPVETGGHYPPWEYNKDSVLRQLYIEKYKEKTGKTAEVQAIHAGLECGVFADAIKGFDCISIGPLHFDIHTTRECLSIKSTKEMYEIVCRMLETLK
ncbi:MAG: beta-Ala-His dipeptidase [Clostridia bacterium]|nr:beta-Ala-His dipeptidase [Clostridia bacterium]